MTREEILGALFIVSVMAAVVAIAWVMT